jgi:hypothetical protein
MEFSSCLEPEQFKGQHYCTNRDAREAKSVNFPRVSRFAPDMVQACTGQPKSGPGAISCGRDSTPKMYGTFRRYSSPRRSPQERFCFGKNIPDLGQTLSGLA